MTTKTPLATCPFCEDDNNKILLDLARLPEYLDNAGEKPLRVHEMPGQKLIAFDSDKQTGPCPHLLQLCVCCTVVQHDAPRNGTNRSGDVDWVHPLMEADDHRLSRFVFERGLGDLAPPIPGIADLTIDCVSSMRDEQNGRHIACRCDGSAYFARDIESLYEIAGQRVRKHSVPDHQSPAERHCRARSSA